MKATSGRGEPMPGRSTSSWVAALSEVAVVGFATVAAVAVIVSGMMTGCGGPVCTPLTAGGTAFVSGFIIATVHWRAWARSRVDRALRDPLTGLPTRAVIEDRLDAATRTGEAVTVALADVDGLHAVNANFGHAAGDRYLTAVAYRLARAVPAGGILVRQGGDEFTLLAPGTDAEGLATAIGAAMSGPAVIAGHRLQPRASVGLATSDGTAGNARHVRARADVAMFAAKEAGGNHIHIWDPDLHGEPDADGTRPLLRRRDTDPLSGSGVAWQPDPGGDLLAILLPQTEANLVYQALVQARDIGVDPTAGDHHAGYGRLVARLGPVLNPDPPSCRGDVDQPRVAGRADRGPVGGS